MLDPDLNRTHIIHPKVAERVAAGCPDEAEPIALAQTAASLSDLGLALLAQGKVGAGLEKLQNALNLCPSSQVAFHNLAAALLERRILRSGNLDAMTQFVCAHLRDFPWVGQYRKVVFGPRFLNVQFVSGKCNLKCRMCQGVNSPGHPDRLSCLAAHDFDRMLAAAPTAFAATLSSGDSDPLLHPEIDRILQVAARHDVQLDLFTNGHGLSARLCRRIVESQVINVVNFSVDAATPETYRAIRGASFERVVKKIEMLQAMKKEMNLPRPHVSLSFVAMADNIAELPAFVRLALRLRACRVFVEHLDGWPNGSGGNHVPTDHPQCFEYARQARDIAAAADFKLVMPEQLLERTTGRPEENDASAVSLPTDPPPPGPDAAGKRLGCCSWIQGTWVYQDGRLDPCCLVHSVADMGNIYDGPLMQNEKYQRVKSLLLTGKVFEACLASRGCQYVLQQRAAGKTLDIITRDDLGDLHPAAAAASRTACQPVPA